MATTAMTRAENMAAAGAIFGKTLPSAEKLGAMAEWKDVMVFTKLAPEVWSKVAKALGGEGCDGGVGGWRRSERPPPRIRSKLLLMSHGHEVSSVLSCAMCVYELQAAVCHQV